MDKNTYKNSNKRNHFNFLDATKNFLYALVFPLAFSFLFMVAMIIVFAILGKSFNEFSKTIAYKYILNIYVLFVYFFTTYFYSKKHNINFFRSTGFSSKLLPMKTIIVMLISIASVFLFAPFVNLTNHLFSLLGYNPTTELGLPLSTIKDLILGIVVLAILPAVIEEFVFRGLILQGLLTKFSKNQAVLFSAIMFMLMHGSLQQTVYQFILGLVLGFVFLATKNLLYSIILHFMNNFIVVISMYKQVAGESAQTASFSGFFSYFMPVVYLIIAVVVIYVLVGYLKTGSLSTALKNLNKLFSKNKSNKSGQENIILVKQIDVYENTGNDSKNNLQPHTLVININNNNKISKNMTLLNYSEKYFFYCGIAIGIVIWVINTFNIL